MRTSPCHGCEDRRVGCHAACEKEQAWLAEQREQKERRTKEQNKNALIEDFCAVGRERARRYRRSRKRK